MATSKDLPQACDALRKRRRWRDARRRAELDVYTKSLIQRFEAVQYAYRKIRRIALGEIRRVTEFEVLFVEGRMQASRDRMEQLGFYANSFLAFSYSLFDVLANVINVVHPIPKDESKVSFGQAAKGYKDFGGPYHGTKKTLPHALLKRLTAVIKADEYRRLNGYRQCCLH